MHIRDQWFIAFYSLWLLLPQLICLRLRSLLYVRLRRHLLDFLPAGTVVVPMSPRIVPGLESCALPMDWRCKACMFYCLYFASLTHSDLSAFTLTGTIPSLVWSLEAFTSLYVARIYVALSFSSPVYLLVPLELPARFRLLLAIPIHYRTCMFFLRYRSSSPHS